MIASILIIFFSFSFNLNAQQMSGDPLVVRAIKENIQICRNNNPRNCIKPVNQPGSKIKAIEIYIQSKETVSFTTYDISGSPAAMEPTFSIKIMAQREPALVDANIELKPDSSLNDLSNLCSQKNGNACFLLGKRLLDDKKEKESLAFLDKSCILKHLEACKFLSDFFFNKKNKKMFEKYSQTSCLYKDQRSCVQVGLNYMGNKKTNEALNIFLETCNTMAEGCFLLGELFEKENPQESLKAYIKGCYFPNGATLCYLAANILDKINTNSKDFPSSGYQYELSSDQAYQLACNKGYMRACSKTPISNFNNFKKDILVEFKLIQL